MEFDWKEVMVIIIASLILGLCFAYPSKNIDITKISLFVAYFLIIILVNVIAKKVIAYTLESDVKTKFWEIYNYGFRRGEHFRKPLPMLWLPFLFSFVTKGIFSWMPILECDITPRVERVSKRHGLYRFSEMTEWHVALISVAGITANLILAVILYILMATINPGFEQFARLNIFYATWCLLPLSSLDGTKIFMGSKILWFTTLIICLFFLAFAFA